MIPDQRLCMVPMGFEFVHVGPTVQIVDLMEPSGDRLCINSRIERS